MHDTADSDRDTGPKPTRDDQPKPTRDDQPPRSETADESANVKAPFAPHEDDDSALGDTDQHSTA